MTAGRGSPEATSDSGSVVDVVDAGGVAAVVPRGGTAVESATFIAPERTLGAFDAKLAARLTAVAADIALVIDGDGVIRDLVIADPELAREPLAPLLGRRWVDTVSVDSEFKVDEMLRTTPSEGIGRWRIVNQRRADDATLTLRFMTVGAGPDGKIIALGRDLRATAALQQRLLQTQQSMERDYLRLRAAESRYRLLFDVSAEATLIVDAATNRFVEVNPAARRLVGSDSATVAGAAFAGVFEAGSRDRAGALLAAAATSATGAEPVEVRLAPTGRDCRLSATLYRQDRATYVLVRLTPVLTDVPAADDGRQILIDVLDRLPDAFVVTDKRLDILAENAAFLDLAQFARREHARGQSLRRFLGRPGIDVDLLVAHLKDEGSVRNFATIFRSQFDTVDEVEVSAVAVTGGDQPCFGFAIRAVGRRLRDNAPDAAAGRDLPRSVEQLTELVGRVSLKEIVRESTDLIERLCIEAALAHTGDNRASAAEILGLSRQSLYSKLHRHGLGNLAGGDE